VGNRVILSMSCVAIARAHPTWCRTRSFAPSANATRFRTAKSAIARCARTVYGQGVKRDLLLIDRLQRLHPAVVADCLDRLGVRNQVLDPAIRPLYVEAKVAGYAATVHCVQMDGVPANREDWYRGELAAVDSLEPGDVMVVSTCTGSYWGELLATASRHRGARGIVADAYTRRRVHARHTRPDRDAIPDVRSGHPLR